METTALIPEQGAAGRLLTRDRFPTTARREYVKEFKPMKERSSLPVLLIALLAAVLHIPGLLIPLWGDGLHGVYMAALSFRDPSRLLSPWMGGAFRLLPKLAMMGVLAAAAGSALVGFADALARNRFWIGAAVALFVTCSLRRRRPLRALSAAWIYLFLVPSVVLMVSWGVIGGNGGTCTSQRSVRVFWRPA